MVRAHVVERTTGAVVGEIEAENNYALWTALLTWGEGQGVPRFQVPARYRSVRTDDLPPAAAPAAPDPPPEAPPRRVAAPRQRRTTAPRRESATAPEPEPDAEHQVSDEQPAIPAPPAPPVATMAPLPAMSNDSTIPSSDGTAAPRRAPRPRRPASPPAGEQLRLF